MRLKHIDFSIPHLLIMADSDMSFYYLITNKEDLLNKALAVLDTNIDNDRYYHDEDLNEAMVISRERQRKKAYFFLACRSASGLEKFEIVTFDKLET